ncbi:MAG: hypothetical protein DWH80_00665 [Planctomycetota bacterium]|nr:MAG: hypothetical protein DWH80_00665 [Planctomycetota bacterium]
MVGEWPKIFQNMRSSCVTAWLENSPVESVESHSKIRGGRKHSRKQLFSSEKRELMKKQKIGATRFEYIAFCREISYLTANPAQNPAQFKSPFATFLIRGDR